MKKHFLAFLALAASAAFAVRAEYSTLALGEEPAAVANPVKAVAIQVVSTNAAGTVAVKRITPLVVNWREMVVETAPTYVDVPTNLYKTVTNNYVTAWRVRYQGAGVVESNVYATAVNTTPAYPAWPDIVVTTNKVAELQSWTNWIERVQTGTVTTTNWVSRSLYKAWTNDLYSATLSGGIKTNALDTVIFPGDRIYATGTALNGGRAVLVIVK